MRNLKLWILASLPRPLAVLAIMGIDALWLMSLFALFVILPLAVLLAIWLFLGANTAYVLVVVVCVVTPFLFGIYMFYDNTLPAREKKE